MGTVLCPLSFVFCFVESVSVLCPVSAGSRALTTLKNQIIMKEKAIFYHAGCPVCVAAENTLPAALDSQRFDVEIVHLAEQRHRLKEAEKLGVKSVPALVLMGTPLHINFGAALSDLK